MARELLPRASSWQPERTVLESAGLPQHESLRETSVFGRRGLTISPTEGRSCFVTIFVFPGGNVPLGPGRFGGKTCGNLRLLVNGHEETMSNRSHIISVLVHSGDSPVTNQGQSSSAAFVVFCHELSIIVDVYAILSIVGLRRLSPI